MRCVLWALRFFILRLSSTTINVLPLRTLSSSARYVRSLLPMLSHPTISSSSSGCHFCRSASISSLSEHGHIQITESTLCIFELIRSSATLVLPVPIAINNAPTFSRESFSNAAACSLLFIVDQTFVRFRVLRFQRRRGVYFRFPKIVRAVQKSERLINVVI